MARAKHRTSRSTKGWAERAPKTLSDRRKVLARCGAGAFLDPGKFNERLKFPVVAKNNGCVPDCQAVRAALSRAAQFGHSRVAMRAEGLGRKLKCRWAV